MEDPADRQEILARLRERIVAYAASRMSRDLAEDLVQEVLLVLTRKYSAVEGLENLLPLAFRILRFKLMSHRRKSRRRGEDTAQPIDELQWPDSRPDPETVAERRETLERVTRALASMEGRCRELFRLKLEGLKFAEIGHRLGAASINTVYTWDLRCRRRLLELLGGSWEGAGTP